MVLDIRALPFEEGLAGRGQVFAFEFLDDIHRNLLHNIVDFLDCWSRALAAFAKSGPAIAGCPPGPIYQRTSAELQRE